jgi:hypothetical protein
MLPTFCNVRLTLSVLPETDGKLVHLARVNIGVGKEVNSWTFFTNRSLVNSRTGHIPPPGNAAHEDKYFFSCDIC